MADNQGKRQRGIEALLAQRKKFETWLAQLEERRASSAEHVFLRVHADYRERLDEVRERLRTEADGIRALVGELEERLATEQQAVTEKSDERAELELRAAVGEFSEKEWNAIRSRLDGTISEIRARFDATERELVEVKQILGSVSGAPRVSEPVPPSAAYQRELPADEPVSQPQRGEQLGGESAAETPASGDGARDEPVAPASESPVPREPTPFDELAFLKSVAGTPQANPIPAREPRREVGREARVEAEPEAPERGRPLSGTMTAVPSPLGAPTPRTSQAVRTLKCQECDTLNFPTEWYCERCGGELAAF